MRIIPQSLYSIKPRNISIKQDSFKYMINCKLICDGIFSWYKNNIDDSFELKTSGIFYIEYIRKECIN